MTLIKTRPPHRWTNNRLAGYSDLFAPLAEPLGYEAGDANLFRYVGNSPTNATDPSGLMPEKGKRNIKVTGVPSNVTVEQLQKIIAEAEKQGASKAHLKALRAQLKVLKRNVKFRGGFANLRVLAAQAGTILIVAEITSIANHACDRIELKKFSQDTNDDGSVNAIYFGKKFEKTGFLGLGPEKHTGSLLYVLTIPKDRIDRDGLPPDKLQPRLNNLEADSDILRKMGIKEEWLELPEGINNVDQLLDEENCLIK